MACFIDANKAQNDTTCKIEYNLDVPVIKVQRIIHKVATNTTKIYIYIYLTNTTRPSPFALYESCIKFKKDSFFMISMLPILSIANDGPKL